MAQTILKIYGKFVVFNYWSNGPCTKTTTPERYSQKSPENTPKKWQRMLDEATKPKSMTQLALKNKQASLELIAKTHGALAALTDDRKI